MKSEGSAKRPTPQYYRADPLQLLLILLATACCLEALRPFIALAGEVYWTVIGWALVGCCLLVMTYAYDHWHTA